MRISYLSFSILEHYTLANDDSLLSKAGKFRVVQLQTCSMLEFKLVGDYDKFKMKHVLLKNNIILRSDTAFRTNNIFTNALFDCMLSNQTAPIVAKKRLTQHAYCRQNKQTLE